MFDKNTNSSVLDVGQDFNPYRMFNGAFVPLAVLSHPDLTPGAKLLYGRLGLYAGKDGDCNPSLKKLAAEMATSEDSVGRWLKELVDEKFIRREHMGPNRSSRCFFLWNDALKSSLKRPVDSADLRNQPTALTPQICGTDSAESRSLDSADLRVPLKEEKIQSEKIHIKESSSSKKNTSVTESHPVNEAGSTTTTRPIISKNAENQNPKPHSSEWWSPEQFEEAREYIRDHKDQNGPLPDEELTTNVLSHFGGKEPWLAFQCWWKTLIHPSKVKGWGLYPSDAAKRGAGLSLHAVELREKQAKQRQQTQAEEAEEAERTEHTQTEIIQKAKKCGWRPIYSDFDCRNCAGFGANPYTFEYCRCVAGISAMKTKADRERSSLEELVAETTRSLLARERGNRQRSAAA